MRPAARALAPALALLVVAAAGAGAQAPAFQLSPRGYLTARGADVLVFANPYSAPFGDQKLSGIEIIQHGVRIATDGDVRLSNTPAQWDPVPQLVERKTDPATNRAWATLRYPQYDFQYRVEVEPRGEGVQLSVLLERPLPAALAGRAGLNLEFLPSAYFGKSYLADGQPGLFPRAEAGAMARDSTTGRLETLPLARAGTFVLAPEDPERRVTVTGEGVTLSLYDGRNVAQNGWFVLRALLPAGRTGTVVRWLVTPNRIPGWTRAPVIAHSQVGYTPGQQKLAIIELDPHWPGGTSVAKAAPERGVARVAATPNKAANRASGEAPPTVARTGGPAGNGATVGKAVGDAVADSVRLLRIDANGRALERLSTPLGARVRYLRYDYARFDFSAVREPGIYVIEYAGVRTEPFPIAPGVYAHTWQATLDTYLPVQMDHMFVKDRYRVWHGAAHLDDARQAPVDHVHFDMYRQGPTTDTPFKPGAHIPGLNEGGWFDAGDFDIRTESQYATVLALVHAREDFGIAHDETTINEKTRRTQLRQPDGVPDIVQQIAHGVIGLLAQYRAVGHAIPGIIDPTLDQYTHLGDAVTDTDNRIYTPSLDSLQVRGDSSGTPDDRWAFTNKSTPLDYGAAAALAAASRVLRGWDDTLADEALRTARRVWDEEQARAPVIFRAGNTSGGPLEAEETNAAVELLLTTRGEKQYADRLNALWTYIARHFVFLGEAATRARPYMDAGYGRRLEEAVRAYRALLDDSLHANPFGVPITGGAWAGSGTVLRFAETNYVLHRAFPAIVGPEYTVRALDYVFGLHPASSVSLVSGVGAHSKTIAYGNNRADYSFIPGGVVPGVLIVQPDFPELKEDWPFLWYEGEYVIPEAAAFVYVANAVNQLLH